MCVSVCVRCDPILFKAFGEIVQSLLTNCVQKLEGLATHSFASIMEGGVPLLSLSLQVSRLNQNRVAVIVGSH